MNQSYERPIKTRLHRNKEVLATRHYSTGDNALARINAFATQFAQIGDTLEVADEVSGKTVALMRVRMHQGRVHLDLWYDADALRLSNQ